VRVVGQLSFPTLFIDQFLEAVEWYGNRVWCDFITDIQEELEQTN
jgi:flagellar biosynthesis regulator FlaF